jgi:hypothetical protein
MASSNRLGVVVEQVQTETPATGAAPALVPVAVAPFYQILTALDDDGDLNSDALYSEGSYEQAALVIPQASFPDPRDNIDELEFDATEIDVQLYFGGALMDLARGSHGAYGKAFLKAANLSTCPVIRTSVATAFDFTSFSTDPTLVVALDAVNSEDTSGDVTITFDCTENYTAAELAAVIEAALGVDVYVDDDGYVYIASTTYGPQASVTIRAGGSAAQVLWTAIDITKEYRVTGAGFRGQDDEDSDVVTPWIEFYRGNYYEDGDAASIPDGDPASELWVGWYSTSQTAGTDTPTQTRPAVQTFSGGSATIPLQAATTSRPGDQFWADGVRLGGSTEVIKVESARFKLGILDATLSTYDDDTGEVTNRVYTAVEVNTVYHASAPLSPKYAYFIADGLLYGSITPAGTAAVLTGAPDAEPLPARPAMIQGAAAAIDDSGGCNVAGLILSFRVTEDGVEGDDVSLTLAGSYTSVATLKTYLNDLLEDYGLAVTFTGADPDYRFALYTIKTGADQAIYIPATSSGVATVNDYFGLATATSTTQAGKDAEYATQAAVVSDDALDTTGGLGDGSTVLDFDIVDSFGTHSFQATVDLSGVTTAATLIAAIIAAFNPAEGVTPGVGELYDGYLKVADITSTGENNAVLLTVTSVEGGSSVSIDLTTAVDLTVIGFGGVADEDVGEDGLSGTVLLFSLDDNPYEYSVQFTSNSLDDAVNEINELVGGSTDIASISDDDYLVLTSAMVGLASKVEVKYLDDACTAETALGFDGDNYAAEGTGRPNPNFYINGDGDVVISASILRNGSTGQPYSLESGVASVYIEYKALRLDLSAAAADPGLIGFSDRSVMAAAVGPVSTENPGALMLDLMMQNAPTKTCYALGLSEVSSAMPMGTLDAWSEALEYLESQEIWCFAPATDDPYVLQLIATHVQAMADPEERGERVCILWTANPDRDPSTTVGSGTEGASTGTNNQFNLGVNLTSDIAAAGLDPSSLDADDGVYLEMVITTLGSQALRRYSVSSFSGQIATVRTSFASGENDDGFYSTTTLSEALEDQSFSLFIRGDELVVTGTSIPDYDAIASALAAQGQGYANRRVFYLQLDSFDTSVGGISTNLPGYYYAAIVAGMSAELNPATPFSWRPVTGVTKVYGTDDTFSENKLDIIADGGRMTVINLGGSRVGLRQQWSTYVAAIEGREMSITKALDYFAKLLRQVNRVYIGQNNITTGFLDKLTLVNKGQCVKAADVDKVLAAADVESVLQSSSDPDTVLITVEVEPLYPCNKIRITIYS